MEVFCQFTGKCVRTGDGHERPQRHLPVTVMNALRGIYLELKQSILVAQSHEMKTKHLFNMMGNKYPAKVRGERT